MTAGEIQTPMPPPQADAPGPIAAATKSEWIKKNLFSNWYNSLVTIAFVLIIAYVVTRAARFFFVTAKWAAVGDNLTLFVQGTFPRDQQWRLIAQLLLLAAFLGWAAGTAATSRKAAALEAGIDFEESTPFDLVKRFWSVIGFVLLTLFFAKTFTPWLVTIAALVIGFGASKVARIVAPRLGLRSWLVGVVMLIAAFQVVIGTEGSAWVLPGLVAAAAAFVWAERFRTESMVKTLLTRLGVAVLAAALIFGIYTGLSFEGVGWDKWSGLHLTLFSAVSAIVLSFPLGLLLALARRSSFPALRFMATGYIELIRGVPLISLLLMGQFFLGFFLGANTDLSDLTRAIVAMTLFTAAYVAEIVRGGLQSLPKGQMEAGLAMGLAVPKIMRLIILPQALRAVIPAMVGQFIALFKDTSLLSIIGISEFLQVRDLIHAQADFRGQGIAETLVFVAIGYWAFAYAMSRESQRLERKLGVGER